MNEKQQTPTTKKDILDIIQVVQPLKPSQKQDILAEIDRIKDNGPTSLNTNVQ